MERAEAEPGTRDAPGHGAGIGFALAAYVAWGLTPAYWKQLTGIPPSELVAWRTLYALAVGVALLAVTGGLRDALRTLAAPRLVLALVSSALLIGANWLVFIHAVQTDRVMHTSLGYYVNPLVSVALGFGVLGERLRPTQSLAVGVAAAGVAWWALRLGGLPWIAVVLAGSFALYGLVRKLAPVASLVGFALEMLVLAPLALAWLAMRPAGGLALADADLELHAWMAAAGLVTAFPLVCFASAARRLPLVVVGLFQYIAPSLALLLAVAFYAEPLTLHHAVTFGFVGVALAIFSLDSLRVRGAAAGWW